VFSAEEENKESQQYEGVGGKGGELGRLNEIVESLPKLLNSHSEACKSMISAASKPRYPPSTTTTNEQTPDLQSAIVRDDIPTRPSAYELESSDDEAPDLMSDDSDDNTDLLSDWTEEETRELDLAPDETEEDTLSGCVFTMEDRSHKKLQEVLSTAGARAATVKGTFRGKPINILLDTGSDIVCVLSHIAPRNEWKKVHNLRV
jgi:hypothetical protein